MRLFIHTMVFIMFLAFLQPTIADAHEFVFTPTADGIKVKGVFLGDTKTGQIKELIKGFVTKDYASLSPNGKHIAFRMPQEDIFYLKVIDKVSKEELSVENTFCYSWSPKEDAIAFLTGKGTLDDRGFIGDGAWVYSFKDKSRKKIAESGHDIHWSAFDNRIYIRQLNGSVDAFDFTKDALEPTTYVSVNFSSDGHYYFRNATFATPEEVYEQGSSENLLDKYFPEHTSFQVYSLRWLDAEHLLLWEHDGYGTMQYLVFCVKDGRILLLPGEPLAYVEESQEFVMPDMKIIPLNKVPVRTQEDLKVFKEWQPPVPTKK